MIALVQSLKVYLCTQSTDMRRSFDGLCGLAAGIMQQDPLSGHLFVFRNRARDSIKILYWDQDGLAIWYKRLEKGTFQFPSDLKQTPLPANASSSTSSNVSSGTSSKPAASLEVTVSDLSMLLHGIDLSSIQRRKRYEPKASRSASTTVQEKP